jgi:hypothetical protein
MSKNDEKQEFNNTIMQANFSALLYVLTEQQALIGRLFMALVDSGQLTSQQLEKITDIYGDGDVLSPVYSDLYKRFAYYYLKTKAVLEVEDDGEVPEVPEDVDKEKDL